MIHTGNNTLEHLIVVPGHAALPEDYHEDFSWVLQKFQYDEAPLYVDHILGGIAVAEADPESILVLSGGFLKKNLAFGVKVVRILPLLVT
jgi:hypothetical protein